VAEKRGRNESTPHKYHIQYFNCTLRRKRKNNFHEEKSNEIKEQCRSSCVDWMEGGWKMEDDDDKVDRRG
jgi:hypothetical protein